MTWSQSSQSKSSPAPLQGSCARALWRKSHLLEAKRAHQLSAWDRLIIQEWWNFSRQCWRASKSHLQTKSGPKTWKLPAHKVAQVKATEKSHGQSLMKKTKKKLQLQLLTLQMLSSLLQAKPWTDWAWVLPPLSSLVTRLQYRHTRLRSSATALQL